MSTTTRNILTAAPVVVVGWILLLASVGVLSDRAPAFVVIFPTSRLINNLPDSAKIVGVNRWTLTLSGDQTGFVKELYRRGAVLVLPAGLKGCFRVS